MISYHQKRRYETMASIYNYPGGKGLIYRNLINQIPPHEVYICPFAGQDAIAQNKLPAAINILNDVCRKIKKFWATIIKSGEMAGKWEIHNRDAFEFIPWVITRLDDRIPRDKIFIYFDPPYLDSSRRSSRNIYKHEFKSYKQHYRLITLILSLPPGLNMMISCYDNDLYKESFRDWRKIQINTVNRAAVAIIETIYMNYPEPVKLHDYSFIGDNFREREIYKKKAKRLIERFKRIPEIERNYLLWILHHQKW